LEKLSVLPFGTVDYKAAKTDLAGKVITGKNAVKVEV
jgi:hypothetical protein